MAAFSTFAQQAVTIGPQRLQLDSSAAILPRAINYSTLDTGTPFFLIWLPRTTPGLQCKLRYVVIAINSLQHKF
jgi:hypothetical protein